ncbi:uncharacterized protein LOC129590547 [Paramacrobiotus metropolitanus]|uniref:uncharacterized protein LOC129590547 n=1 Tax=Paramacrobiotus metropolitanus TaxID=2943436 RepID=UPI002445B0D5|nr:uncharacterized protein LOC129590547 [Paramacrobiotus metropolitanus]
MPVRTACFTVAALFLTTCIGGASVGATATQAEEDEGICTVLLTCPNAAHGTLFKDTGSWCCRNRDRTMYCCDFADYVHNRTGLSLAVIIGISVIVVVVTLLAVLVLACCCGCRCLESTCDNLSWATRRNDPSPAARSAFFTPSRYP